MNSFSSSWYILIIGVVISSLWYSCASTGRPNGGPRDEFPPELVPEKSSPQGALNYRPNEIKLYFDEWIELRNPNKEIDISPPFFKRPEITQRGKHITVKFPEDEPLRTDATYVLSFGKSIVDFTEGNVQEGFTYIFSTGDRLDTLTVKGQVVDAYTNQPVKDVIIVMYDELGDSIVIDGKPFYYVKPDEKGNYEFSYIRSDTFKILAFEDKNFNFLLDAENERLSFLDSFIFVSDSMEALSPLRVFEPRRKPLVSASNARSYGKILIEYLGDKSEVTFKRMFSDDDLMYELYNDSLIFWYNDLDTFDVIFSNDTLAFKLPKKDSLFLKSGPKITMEDSKIPPYNNPKILASVPIQSIDTSKMTLWYQLPKDSFLLNDDQSIASPDTLISMPWDSIKVLDDQLVIENDSLKSKDTSLIKQTIQKSKFIDTASFNKVLVNFKFEKRELYIDSVFNPLHNFTLTMLPGAITDIYGRVNDTTTLTYGIRDTSEYSAMHLTFDFRQYKTITRDTIITGIKTDTMRLDSLPTEKLVLDSLFTLGILDSATINTLNQDTISWPYEWIVSDTVSNRVELPSIEIIDTSKVDTFQYIILLLKGKEQVYQTEITAKDSIVIIDDLQLGQYTLHLIRDINRDGRWTTGDYWAKRQPEMVKIIDLKALSKGEILSQSISWYRDTAKKQEKPASEGSNRVLENMPNRIGSNRRSSSN